MPAGSRRACQRFEVASRRALVPVGRCYHVLPLARARGANEGERPEPEQGEIPAKQRKLDKLGSLVRAQYRPYFLLVGRGNCDSDGRAERSVGSTGAFVPGVLGDAEVASRLRGVIVGCRVGVGVSGGPAYAERATEVGAAAD